MRDSFVCSDFVLDLSRLPISYVEENPRFSDSFFTKYSFPFEFYLDSDLRKKMGHYDSLRASGLEKKIKGYHVFEGRIKEGTLEILEVQGNLVKAQIDSGFDELPNFDKKLSDLFRSETITVDNIYEHAESVCAKKYPETSYNFPCVIFDKHSKDEPGWEIFNKFLNDRNANGFVDNNEDGSDWDETPEDERVDADKFHKNRNIIHPMPYVLHVLKTGFSDAGYELQGDVLSDEDFLQRVVYDPNAEYSFAKESETVLLKIDFNEGTHEGESLLYYFNKQTTLKKGAFLLRGSLFFNAFNYYSAVSSAKILINNSEIYRIEKRHGRDISIDLNISFENSVENGILEVQVSTFEPENLPAAVADLQIDFRKNLNQDGDKIKLFNNRNEFSLGDFVPDMTFGDFVRTIKMWKNYDIAVRDNTIIMNKLSTSLSESMKDVSRFSVATPIKTFVNKRSFNVLFPEIDNKKENVFIDYKGHKMGGTPLKESTDIDINGYCLPIETFRGKTTAKPKIDDNGVLGLIYYDGLHNGGNFAQEKPGLMLPDILNVLLPWYEQRIVSNEFRWSFYANKNQWRDIDVKDTLYAYGHKVWIREINKTVIDERTYQIEIVVESVK